MLPQVLSSHITGRPTWRAVKWSCSGYERDMEVKHIRQDNDGFEILLITVVVARKLLQTTHFKHLGEELASPLLSFHHLHVSGEPWERVWYISQMYRRKCCGEEEAVNEARRAGPGSSWLVHKVVCSPLIKAFFLSVAKSTNETSIKINQPIQNFSATPKVWLRLPT